MTRPLGVGVMRVATKAGLLAAVATLVVGSASLQAQRDTRPDRPDRTRLEQRIRAQMGRMMRERLGLTDDEATRLSDVVQGFDQRRRELFRTEQTLKRESETLRASDHPDQDEAAALLGRMTALRAHEATLFAEEQDALRAVLTPVQVLQLHALREAIGQRIRSLRNGRGGSDGRRGGDGGRIGAADGHLDGDVRRSDPGGRRGGRSLAEGVAQAG